MTVREIWVARQHIKVTGVGYEPNGDFTPSPEGQPFEDDWRELLLAAFSCNNARLNPPSLEHPQWTSLGDQTEAAMKVAAMKAQFGEGSLELAYPRVHEIPLMPAVNA